MSTNSTPPSDPSRSDPRPARRTLNLYVVPDSTVDRIVNLSGERELSRTVAGMLDRYLALLHRATPKFSDRELCAIIDALGDNWEATPGNIQNLPREVMSAVTADRLDSKWELDAATLRPRLDRTTFVERVTLAEMATGYWQLATAESYPQDIIAQLKALLRSPDTKPTETQRPRRVSPEAFDRGSSRNPDTGDANAYQGDDSPGTAPGSDADDNIPDPPPDSAAAVADDGIADPHADTEDAHSGANATDRETHSPASPDPSLAQDPLL